MKSIHRNKKSSTPSPVGSVCPQGWGKRFEWPLLAFPAAVLATLLALYVVNRSIQHQGPVRPVEAESAGLAERHSATRASDLTAVTARSAGRVPRTRLNSEAGTSQIPDRPPLAREAQDREAMTGEVVTEEETGSRGGLQAMDSTGRIILMLQEAIQEKDHTRIKQCLDELVALGDRVIAPLTQVIAREQGEVGMWAAEALARIGSPLATSTLLDTLTQIKEGQYKEELAKRVAGINNHESWPVLLENALSTADSTVLRAAGEALARMADAPIVDELIARFDGATDVRDTERIAQLIGNIHSSKATDSLISLAGDVASAPQDALARAAVEALGKTGDPQAISYLMRKLEATPPGQDGYLVNTISQIKEPQAQDALLYAAAGNKEVSADGGRTAAIYALRNFPNARTCALLEEIVATEQNARVVTAAARTLDELRKTSPHVVASAQSLVKKDTYTGTDLIKK